MAHTILLVCGVRENEGPGFGFACQSVVDRSTGASLKVYESEGKIWVIMELVEGGELYERIHRVSHEMLRPGA